jgi:Domain of unknown function (DUF5615)
VKFKLDENLPVSSAAILASARHDVDTVSAEGLTGAADQDALAREYRRSAIIES